MVVTNYTILTGCENYMNNDPIFIVFFLIVEHYEKACERKAERMTNEHEKKRKCTTNEIIYGKVGVIFNCDSSG